jgi:hypothetical protein
VPPADPPAELTTVPAFPAAPDGNDDDDVAAVPMPAAGPEVNYEA